MGCLQGSLILSIISIYFSHAQDILGCGGFVKSDYKLDFSNVKVQLLTSSGGIKFSSEPSPNGYYMIPIYEKGSYHVKLAAKDGWNFEPNRSVPLDLGACERNEDLNFVFTGFTVSGRVVSEGSDGGPDGVQVQLMSNAKQLASYETSAGRFKFENVHPGDYILKSVDKSVSFSKSESAFKVTDDALELGNTLLTHGYSLSGRIVNEGQPVKGVYFILKSDKIADVHGCTKGSLPYPSFEKAICYSLSDENGNFKFESVPYGRYLLVPFHRGEKTVFEVSPEDYSIEIKHENYAIQKEFTVSGFGVSGTIKYSQTGKAVSGALVYINDGRSDPIATDDSGVFYLEGIKSGSYKLSVKAKSIYFDDVIINVTPSETQLPFITATRFDLCGKVRLDKPEANIEFLISDTKTSKAYSSVADANGEFCAPVAPGNYIIEPKLKPHQKSIIIQPPFVKVSVVDQALVGESAVIFLQFLAKLSGRIVCITDCGELKVTLKLIDGSSAERSHKITSSSKEAEFVFSDVLPGSYRLTVHRMTWCWLNEALTINVNDKDLSNIHFKQQGYQFNVLSTHHARLDYVSVPAREGDVVVNGSVTIEAGINKLCLPILGQYDITPKSCHRFEKNTYRHDIRSDEPLRLVVVKHTINFVVTSPIPVDDIILHIMTDDGTVVDQIKMAATQVKDAINVCNEEKEIPASISHLTVRPHSSAVLFNSDRLVYAVEPGSCPAARVVVTAQEGTFVSGTIKPKLPNFEIVLLNNSLPIAKTRTDESGNYRFGPLPKEGLYDVTAERSGYIVEKERNDGFDFIASRMAGVTVHVKSNGVNLPGVILSLSGGSYRSNNLTDSQGQFSFIGLTPGQYYLRAILKEYEFKPASHMVEVTEGVDTQVVVDGTRVAYSCSGSVVSLRGDGVASPVTVKAHGIAGGPCDKTEESTKVELDGSFRIRGLKPHCSYRIEVLADGIKETTTEDKAMQSSSIITMNEEDLSVGALVLVPGTSMTEVAVFVNSPASFLSQLKVVLVKEGSSTAIQAIPLGSSKVVFFTPLPKDNMKYKVYLETTLSRQLYEISSEEINFYANSSIEAFALVFNAKVRRDMAGEIKESNILALVIVVLSTVVVLYREQILGAITPSR